MERLKGQENSDWFACIYISSSFLVIFPLGSVSIPASSSRTAKMEVTDAGDVKYLEHVQVLL